MVEEKYRVYEKCEESGPEHKCIMFHKTRRSIVHMPYAVLDFLHQCESDYKVTIDALIHLETNIW